MLALHPIKVALIGLLLASPLVAAWVRKSPEKPEEIVSVGNSGGMFPAAAIVRMPVEVVSSDGKSRWVYVALESRAVPEPGILSLAALTGLLLLVRRR